MAGCDESGSVEEGSPKVGFRRDGIAGGVPERSGKCSETFKGGEKCQETEARIGFSVCTEE